MRRDPYQSHGANVAVARFRFRSSHFHQVFSQLTMNAAQVFALCIQDLNP